MVSGVEISADSVRYAKHNAQLNGVENATWISPSRSPYLLTHAAGNAEAIFSSIEFPAAQTTVLIDPPRKGCDDAFLKQLIAFGPAHIIYVSCAFSLADERSRSAGNVHTQARDIGALVRDGNYLLKSLRGAVL